MIRLLLIISLAFVAANCGQKGPLEPPTASGPQVVSITLDSNLSLHDRPSRS